VDITPETFVADYTGEPGERTFFIQARGEATRTFLAEKQQVELLADRLREMLVLLDSEDAIVSATPARDPALTLEAPIEAEWRIGTIAIGYVEESDNVVVSIAPVQEDPPEDPEEIEFDARFFLDKSQVRSFVLHALAVVAEGRPLCQLCGLPMDPSGHNCPASNGHRAVV
jgi:uncharacterized repeat protein (TIGR03847 family)